MLFNKRELSDGIYLRQDEILYYQLDIIALIPEWN